MPGHSTFRELDLAEIAGRLGAVAFAPAWRRERISPAGSAFIQHARYETFRFGAGDTEGA